MTEATAIPANRPGRAAKIIWVLCLIYAAFVMFENAQEIAWVLTVQPGAGVIGVKVQRPNDSSGYLLVQTVTPDSPIAKSGVAVGARVRFDRRYDWFRRYHAGERIGFNVLTQAGPSHRVVVAEPPKAPDPAPLSWQDWLSVFYSSATALAAVIGAFIVWRGRGTTSTLLLGMGLMTYGLISFIPQLDVSGPILFPLAFVVGLTNLDVIPILFYRFAIQFYVDQVGDIRPAEKLVFWLYASLQLSMGLLGAVCYYFGVAAPFLGMGDELGALTSYVGFGACFFYLILGWRRSVASGQQRYALMLVATAAIVTAQGIDYISSSVSGFGIDQAAFVTFHFAANALLTGVVGAGLFAYSILRHRVFDLGFALNRTLVYGVVSALLLAVFGIVEWGVDHLVPIQGREKNALIDAAIAVGVFLTFHRVRDFVEHGVESLFFRRWQKAEQMLRRFVREAPFFTDSAALLRAGARALGAYADNAPCALYLAGDIGCARSAGDFAAAPVVLEPDLPVLVRLRAELKPAEIEDGPLKGALAAPMVNRNEVIGVAILAPKPSGGAWRPDEIELIGWATTQIGLDLHALKIETLTKSEDDLRRENATLRSLIPQRA